VGGRLGYVLFYDLAEVLHDPLRLVRVWEGGMASHGGILGIFLYTLWYAKRHKISWTGLGDNLVVVATIGIFFGRCANFINGELFGRATNVAWAMQFPKELEDDPDLANRAIHACIDKVDPSLTSAQAIVEASRTSAPVREVLSHLLTPRHPSQLYEAGMEGVVLFTLLWLLRTRTRVPEGVVTGAFFLLYALVRILGEQFREHDVGIPFTLGLTRGQFLSLFMIVIGLAFIIVSFKRNHPSPRP
jgi:phosphatidylglycerol:prolipoprotein diacylglycerol transferase